MANLSTIEKAKIRNYISEVIKWLEEQNVIVVFSLLVSDEFRTDCNTICINSRQNLRSQLHALLHEAGHYEVRKNTKLFKERFPNLPRYRSVCRDYKLERLREEIMAWDAGLELSKKFGFDINLHWWFKHVNKSILTYTRWINNETRQSSSSKTDKKDKRT